MPTSGSSSGWTSRSRSSRAGSKASPRARAKASGCASWSTARGASPRSNRLEAGRGRPGRRRGRPDRPRVGHCPAPPGPAGRSAARPRHVRDARSSRTRSRSRSRRKIGALLAADEAASPVKGIAFTETIYAAQRDHTIFAASDGSSTDQTITHVGLGHRDERDRRRRAPAPKLPGRGRRLAVGRLRVHPRACTWPTMPRSCPSEAVALLTAPQCPSGRMTVVLDPSQLYLQVHESCGHPTELDRVFGTEASYAGTSFLTHGQARCGLSLRLGPDRHRRRCHRAGRPGHVRLGRRGRRRPGRAADQGRHPRRLPEQPRDRAADRAPVAAARCGPTAGTASR